MSGQTADGQRAMTERRPVPDGGFSVLQVLLLLALVALAAGALVPLGSRLLSIERTRETEEQLRDLRAAILGFREAEEEGRRGDFGYLGDFGKLPDSLPQILRPLGQPGFGVSEELRLGAGWRGPYLALATREDTAAVRVDAWGRPIRWVTADTTDDGGEVWDGFLESGGSDGSPDTGDDDVVVPIRRSETTADLVSGFVTDTAGNAVGNRAVTLTLRRVGALKDTTDFTDGGGRYEFRDVPLGTAMIRLGKGSTGSGPGRLELVPASAVDTTIQGDKTVQFEVFNPGDTEVVLTSLAATYDRTAFYRWIIVNQPGKTSKEVFDAQEAGGPWPGSGDLVNFQVPDTIPPTGASATSGVPPVARVVSIDGPEIRADTLFSPDPGGDISSDQAVVIRLREFRANPNGTGQPVDMTGVDFTIEFSDGSVVTFTTPP